MHCPFIHRNGADATVDRQSRLVPVEADPFHTAAVAFNSKVGKIFQQSLAIAQTASLWKDEKVFEIQTLAPHKSGEIMKKQGKTYDHAVFFGKDHFGLFFLKQRMVQSGLIGNDFVGTFFIHSEFLDEFKNETCFFRLRWTYGKRMVFFIIHILKH